MAMDMFDDGAPDDGALEGLQCHFCQDAAAASIIWEFDEWDWSHGQGIVDEITKAEGSDAWEAEVGICEKHARLFVNVRVSIDLWQQGKGMGTRCE